jgi:hypothetical protein
MKKTRDSELLIIKLAIKYGIADKDQLLSALPEYRKQKSENANLDIGSYLIQSKLITDKQFQFLQSVVKMSEITGQDKNFGIIAIKNNFTSQFHVKKALQYQSRVFKKSYDIRLIGDILVEWDQLLTEQRDAILSRQNRLDTLEHMQFGQIALEKQYIDEKTLEDSLKEQWRDFKRETKIRLLGEVLVDNEMLTLSQRDAILSTQRDYRIQHNMEQKEIHNKKLESVNGQSDDDSDLSVESLSNISEQEKFFAAIAIKNGLVTLEQIKTAFKKQSRIFKTSSSVRLIGDILADDDVLDKTYRDAILSRQNRLEIKDEDVQFGTIAVKEGYVSQESVDQALELQLKEFEQKKQITLLGDILVAAGDLTNEQLRSILKRQRELKALLEGDNGHNILPEPSSDDKQLLSELDQMSKMADADISKEKDDPEPDAPDSLDTSDTSAISSDPESDSSEVSAASDPEHESDKKIEPDNGDDEKDLDDDTEKTIDKDIDHTLVNVQSSEEEPEPPQNEIDDIHADTEMSQSETEPESESEPENESESETESEPPPPPKPKRYSFPMIRVIQNKMEAYVFVKHNLRPSTTVEDIKSMLAQRDITYGIIPDEEIQKYIDTPELHKQNFLIAKGDETIQPKDDEIVYHFERERKPGTEKEDGAMDFKDRGETPHVVAGQLVAERILGHPGQEGKTIFGDIQRIGKYERKSLLCGKGIQLSSDRNQAHAKLSGLPVLSQRDQLSIENELMIHGDVDMKTGHIKYEGFVNVRGVVESNFYVRAQRLSAQGIMAAKIETTGDVKVKGGIIGATINTKGQVHAKFVKGANINANGNVYVEKEILDSTIITRGECVIDRGRVMASDISASRGIIAKSVGSDTSPECQLTIGTDTTSLDKLMNYKRNLANNTRFLNEYEAPINYMKKLLQEIDEQIEDLNILIDRIEDAKPGAEKRLRLLRQTNKRREIKLYEDKLLNMESKISSARDSQRLYKKEWDDVNRQIVDYDPRILAKIEGLKEENVDLEEKIKNLQSEIRRNKGKFSIVIHGFVARGTSISGPEASIVLDKDRNNVTIQEVSQIKNNQEEKLMVVKTNEEQQGRRKRWFGK